MLLQISNLRKSFKGADVLKGVDLQVEKGQILGIIGPSGSGKSTLLRCIDFLETPDSGRYELDGRFFDAEHAAKPDIQYMRQNTAMVFQQFNLFKYKTALENVMEGPLVVHKRDKAEVLEEAREYLRRVGLEDRMDFFPRQLSGGQQQRVAIARALALHPKVILFDEPTSALDPEMVGEVLAVIKSLAEEGDTMVIVSHEMGFIRRIADKVMFIDEGVVAEYGDADEVMRAPKSERLRQFLRRFNEFEDYVI